MRKIKWQMNFTNKVLINIKLWNRQTLSPLNLYPHNIYTYDEQQNRTNAKLKLLPYIIYVPVLMWWLLLCSLSCIEM